MRVTTLNVNGIRSATAKGVFDWLKRQNADVICLQEVKAHESDITDAMRPKGYHAYFNCAQKKGYAGVALYTRREPDKVHIGFGSKEHDDEGRYLQADFGKLSVVSLYQPSGSAGPHRQESKYRFMDHFFPVLKRLRHDGREYIICGDWNIAHKEIDLKKFRLPSARACLADESVRRARLGRRVSHAQPEIRAVHLVVESRSGVGEERRVADRLRDRHPRHRSQSSQGTNL
jgi:exodeoxyribonuclease-3